MLDAFFAHLFSESISGFFGEISGGSKMTP